MAESITTTGGVTLKAGKPNHEDKQGCLSQREKDIEERIKRIERFMQDQKV